MASNSKYYNTGGGELKFVPIVNGVLGEEVDFGETENVSFNTTVTNITHDNSETSTTYEDMSLLSKITGKISIDTIEISPDNLERAYLGNKVSTDVASANGVSDTVTFTKLDTAYYVGVKYLSNLVVENSGNTVTYVEGTDYTADLDAGTITALSTGSITAGETCNLTYDNSAYTDYRIEGFIKNKLEGKLIFISNPANGLKYTYTFHKVSLLANGDYKLKSSTEFSKLSFEGTMLASELVTGEGLSKLFKIEASEKK